MKIIVLAGGLSPERDVSLTSGAGICKTLREKDIRPFCWMSFSDFHMTLTNSTKFLISPAVDWRSQKVLRQPFLILKL